MFASLHTATLATRRVQSVGSFTRLVRTTADALAARRQRKALRNLDAHTLSDLGLTRDEALAEANRPLWDVPAHWHR